MKRILLSTEKSHGSFRERYPHYEHVVRVTPSGRVYSSVSLTGLDGSGVVHTSELTRDGSRALRTTNRNTFKKR